MAYLQRRRGSSTRLRLFIPSASGSDQMDFSVATRSILEGIVMTWAARENLDLTPLEYCMQGVDLQQGPCYLAHIVEVIDVKAEAGRTLLEEAARNILATHETREGYFQALNAFLASCRSSNSCNAASSSTSSRLAPPTPPPPPSAEAGASSSGEAITREEVLFLMGLCGQVALGFVRGKQEEALLHCLAWSTQFVTECSPASAWIHKRGGWACAFDSVTPHLSFGLVGVIASLICVTALLLLKKR